MSDLKFSWDHRKATSNKKKHGISFEEVQTVFYDELAVKFYDSDHSNLLLHTIYVF